MNLKTVAYTVLGISSLLIVAAVLIDGFGALFWIAMLGIMDAIMVVVINRVGVSHGEPTPKKPEDSPAVRELLAANAERRARIEAAYARAALPSGETAKP
jgi:hypothetical protein